MDTWRERKGASLLTLSTLCAMIYTKSVLRDFISAEGIKVVMLTIVFQIFQILKKPL